MAFLNLLKQVALLWKKPEQYDVFTFNVLAQPLANKKWYMTTDEAVLDSQHRLDKFRELMNEQVKHKRIICLQEVPNEWRQEFEIWFKSKGYQSFSCVQGAIYNDYMGVMMAIPPQFSVNRVKYLPIQTLISRDKFESEDRYNEVSRVWNWIIVAELNTGVTVATTHFPCKFKDPEAMNIYAECTIQALSCYPKVILTGDFNTMPNSKAYSTLCGSYSSAYCSFYGSEPEFTNKAISTQNPTGYHGTLDYIFYRGTFNVVSVTELPKLAEFDGTLPNMENISDHLPVQAMLNSSEV